MTTTGCIHFYFGDGKGKTSAAVGLALRALGHGFPVMLAQFLKDGSSGECTTLKKLGVQVLSGKASANFYSGMSAQEKHLTQKLHSTHIAAAREFVGEKGLLILDEIGDALALDSVEPQALFALLDARGPTEIVMTGHAPLESLLTRADYQTEMRCRRHPYERGLHARPAVEY